jgi:hypothetical protein
MVAAEGGGHGSATGARTTSAGETVRFIAQLVHDCVGATTRAAQCSGLIRSVCSKMLSARTYTCVG